MNPDVFKEIRARGELRQELFCLPSQGWTRRPFHPFMLPTIDGGTMCCFLWRFTKQPHPIRMGCVIEVTCEFRPTPHNPRLGGQKPKPKIGRRQRED